MPRLVPLVSVVQRGEEEAEDPDKFEVTWKKAQGDPPELVKEYRKFIRHADYHFDQTGVAINVHIPASHRSVEILEAQYAIIQSFKESKWRDGDAGEFVERVITHHNNSIRFKRSYQKKQAEKGTQPVEKKTKSPSSKKRSSRDDEESDEASGSDSESAEDATTDSSSESDKGSRKKKKKKKKNKKSKKKKQRRIADEEEEGDEVNEDEEISDDKVDAEPPVSPSKRVGKVRFSRVHLIYTYFIVTCSVLVL